MMKIIEYKGNISEEHYLLNVLPHHHWSRKVSAGNYIYGLCFVPNKETHVGVFYTISQIIGSGYFSIQEIGHFDFGRAMMENDHKFMDNHALIHINPERNMHLWRKNHGN